jgi:hypothetical protein
MKDKLREPKQKKPRFIACAECDHSGLVFFWRDRNRYARDCKCVLAWRAAKAEKPHDGKMAAAGAQ